MLRLTLGILSLLLIVSVAVAPATAKEKKTIESYKGNAVMMTGGGASVTTLNIYRWSSDEEREEIIAAIKESTDHPKHNDRRVAQSLRGHEKAGYAFFAGQQGYPLRYARKFEVEDGSQTIVLATDRPVSFGEAYSQSQLGDFDVTLIVLKLDANGKGEGVISVGTEVKWDNAADKLNVTNVTSQPIKLTAVHMVK